MNNFSKFLIKSNQSIREAIGIIDKGAAQIALVIDEAGRLLGTVTDGDIRRGLIQGMTLESPVKRIMYRDFRALPQDATASQALAMMKKEQLHQIPVLDENGAIIKLYLLKELLQPRHKQNRVILMAGGQGKRLRPLTENCPKPMLQIGGKPMLEIILERCIEAGFRHFSISVNYLKHQIIDYFDRGTRWDIEIEYLEEDRPLGTAGALSLIPTRPTSPILVLNSDVLTRIDLDGLLRFHEEQKAVATLCLREHETQIPYGVVHTDSKRVKAFEEKPILTHYVNAGLYVLEPQVMDLLEPDQYCDMPDLLERVLNKNQLIAAFPIHEYWLDVGHPETFSQAKGEWE